MTRLRALIDLRLAGYRTGGIARYATELYAALAKLDSLNVRAVRSRRDRTADPEAVRIRTPPHHRLERSAIGVEMLLAWQRPDVYHATDFVAPRLPGVRCVATVHDLAFLRWPEYLQPDALEYYRRIRRSKSSTAAWITPSQWTASLLSEYLALDPSSISVIPHGVSLNLGSEPPVPREERGEYILAVGTVEPRKRYGLLLDALERFEKPPPLIVAGAAGWNSAETERRLATSPSVTWIADAGDERLRDLYRRATALVIPSQDEGFGLPALEAMACGTPVVSSGHGALPEVTGDAALRPDEDTPDGWSAAIATIRNDHTLWSRLSEQGHSRARDYTWERSAELTADLYRRVAGE